MMVQIIIIDNRATGDWQNPVERTQAAVGKAISNGAHLEWDYYKRFEDLTQEEIQEMTQDDYIQYEDIRIKKNVKYVCEDLSCRVQDSPGPRGSMDFFKFVCYRSR